MRVRQARHLLAAFAVLGLLLAPVGATASSSSGGASQSAAKHKPDVSAELKKLKKKLAALESLVLQLSVNGPTGYADKASTGALKAAVADFEKNTEGVSGRVGRLEAPLGGVLTGAFPGNVQIVDGSLVGADIAPNTVASENIFNNTITSTDLAPETILSGNILNGTIVGGLGGDIGMGTLTGFNVDPSSVQLRGATTGCTGTNKVAGITVGGDVSCSADLGSHGSEIATSTFEQPRVVNVSNVLLNYVTMMPFVVTDLTGAVDGQRVTLIAANSNVTVLDTGVFKLSAAWVPNADDTLTVVKNGMSWYEVARSAN
jgi:hypothetical protein